MSAHADPVASVALALAAILLVSKLAGDLAARIGQPPVLGELVAGVVLGNLALVGLTLFEPVKSDAYLEMLSRLGVLLLLFEVGLESTIGDMLRVGGSATLVACLGVAGPFALGWLVGAWLVPQGGSYSHAFLGATLSATSVGITARVLQDLKQSQSREARIILGAAVVDDILGLVILAAVVAAIAAADRGDSVAYSQLAGSLLKALLFLGGAFVVGAFASTRVFELASRLRVRGVLLTLGLSFCFVFSWLASAVGLAAIVGAFAAGLILEERHGRDFTGRGEPTLRASIEPISTVLVPVFFVLMGVHTDLRSFAQPGVALLAGALTAAAIVGKQLCSFGVVARGVDRLTVGIGMIPRGEVGLIFANIGLGLTIAGRPVVTPAAFSALVLMVIVTTVITPPALRWSLRRPAKRRIAPTRL